VHVNPLVTLLAIVFLAEFMGVAGAVLAVPAAAAAQIVARELLAARRERILRSMLAEQAAAAAGTNVPSPPEPSQPPAKS
jgi:predicted PurR-regulated permease PerM